MSRFTAITVYDSLAPVAILSSLKGEIINGGIALQQLLGSRRRDARISHRGAERFYPKFCLFCREVSGRVCYLTRHHPTDCRTVSQANFKKSLSASSEGSPRASSGRLGFTMTYQQLKRRSASIGRLFHV